MSNLNIIRKLARVQKETLGTGNKSGVNPRFNSKYLTFDDAIAAIKKSIIDHDIVVTHGMAIAVDAGGLAEITTTLTCAETAETVKCVSVFPIERMSAHGVQSAVTYGKRQNLANLFGLAEVDDDGNEAVDDKPKKRATKSKAAHKREDWPAFEEALNGANTSKDVDKIREYALQMFPDEWQEAVLDKCIQRMNDLDLNNDMTAVN